MTRTLRVQVAGYSFLVVGFLALLAAPAVEATCAPDSVQVGPVCVDKYEASVWHIPPSNTTLKSLLKAGLVSRSLLLLGGATQVAPAGTCSASDYPLTFPNTGNWTAPLYAVSIPGVLPSACLTWFQAEQACALSGKRLLTNQEWQRAAAGTVDPAVDDEATTCNVSGPPLGPVNTGSRSACVSNWGAQDMVGNVWEWVGDWGDLAQGCTHWPAGFGGDVVCIGDGAAAGATLPGALVRGGDWGLLPAEAGVFAAYGFSAPSEANTSFGFRCAR